MFFLNSVCSYVFPSCFPTSLAGVDPYEDSQVEFEDSQVEFDDTTIEADEVIEDETDAVEYPDEGAAVEAEEGTADDSVPLVPLMVVPWNTVPKNGVRPFCHFENCKLRMSSKNNLSMHLATMHDNYIIDVRTLLVLIAERKKRCYKRNL